MKYLRVLWELVGIIVLTAIVAAAAVLMFILLQVGGLENVDKRRGVDKSRAERQY